MKRTISVRPGGEVGGAARAPARCCVSVCSRPGARSACFVPVPSGQRTTTTPRTADHAARRRIRRILDAGRVLYLVAPLLAAAAVSGIVLRFDLLTQLARPIDGGRTWRGRRLLGDGKTWRGGVVAVAVSTGAAAVQ